QAVAEHRGAVIVSMGTEFVACFGYPVVHEDDAQRAVRAALRIARSVRPPSDVRVGVHSGLAVIDELHGRPGAPAIQGNVPNIAAALSSRGRSGAVTISDAARSRVRGLFKVEALPGEAFGTGDAGKAAPQAYTVLEEVGVQSRFEGFVTELTPLFG